MKSRAGWVVLAVVPLSMALLLSGCGGDDGPAAGEAGGACLDGGTCNDGLECVADKCQAKATSDVQGDACTADCEGRVCGDDGCGGTCGECQLGICSASGQCDCTPSCDGKKCGDDGCGGECGQCFVGENCVDGVCECEPQCGGKECGDDGCGGECGGCENGVCKEDGMCCHPFCDERECGADGCGGSCGDCLEGLSCYDGVCDCRPAEEAGAEIPDASGNNLVWVKIKAGCFQMGCEGEIPTCLDDEKPMHQKQVDAFQILKTEVTRTQYKAIMNEDSGVPADCMECPITGLTFEKAQAFCVALGARLPTEGEWEYAARGGETTPYPCGDDPTCLDTMAWHADNSGTKLQIVAQKSPNGYGLYDMVGNAWERVEDCYHPNFELAPQEAFPAWTADCDLDYRVAKGGSATDIATDLHVTRRMSVAQTLAGGVFGFRCVRQPQ